MRRAAVLGGGAAAVAGVGGIVAAVVAFSGPTVSSGTVVDRYYSAGYTWWMTQCWPVGQNACGMVTLIPVEEPEHYVLTLENCALREEGDKDCPQGRVDVDPGTYQQIRVGDVYTGSRS